LAGPSGARPAGREREPMKAKLYRPPPGAPQVVDVAPGVLAVVTEEGRRNLMDAIEEAGYQEAKAKAEEARRVVAEASARSRAARMAPKSREQRQREREAARELKRCLDEIEREEQESLEATYIAPFMDEDDLPDRATRASYKGWCKACGRRVMKGQWILHHGGRGNYTCVDCGWERVPRWTIPSQSRAMEATAARVGRYMAMASGQLLTGPLPESWAWD